MKRNIKAWAGVAIILIVIFVTITNLPIGAKSEDNTSHNELMSAMGISKTGEKLKAPDFALKDLNGKKIRLSNLRGKVVLINFWTTW
jgi:cytochrome oxidase Cu insertion factor (SCO1/SenC/PrrC family)